MIRALLAVLLLVSTVHAALRTITVDGEFRQQSANHYFGLALPIPFHFFVSYDDEAEDEAPLDPTIGIYGTDGAYGGLSFGTGLGFHWIPFTNTEVRVWNGKDGLAQAIGFGNEDGFVAYGLYIEPYRAYALFPDVFFPVSNWDDSLHQVNDHAGDIRFEITSYVFLFGHTLSDYTETWLETSTAQRYFVQ